MSDEYGISTRTYTVQFPTYPDRDDIDMLCLQQRVDLPQRGDRKPFLFLLHLQSFQSHDLVGLLISCPVNNTVRPFLNAVEAVELLHTSAAL